MQPLRLRVNGQTRQVTVDPETPLLYILNDNLNLTGPRFGCGLAQCGACTVLIGGKPVRSCRKPIGSVGTDEIVTLDGLGSPEKPHPIQQAFIDEGAAQCGYCLSGVILTAKSVLDANPRASDQQIRTALSGVLCRCYANNRMMRAIRRYAHGLPA